MPGLVKVVGIDREIANTSRDAVIENMSHKRPIRKRNEGLGERMSQRLEPRAEAGSEKESFAHGSRMMGISSDWKEQSRVPDESLRR